MSVELQIPGSVKGLSPYQAGKPIDDLAREFGLNPADIIKLASNENPLGMPLSARQAIETLVQGSAQGLGRYPDPNGFDLKSDLAKRYDVPMSFITLGNGSNDLLELISLALLNDQSSCVYSQHAFVVYRLATQARGARHLKVPALNYGHDLNAMFDAISDDTKLVFIANPNNPTGTFIPGDQIEAFVKRVNDQYGKRVVVVLDEAYNEYLDPEQRFNSADLVKRYANLIVVRTFSKAYGLAALRVGFALAQSELTDYLNRVRQPFNVNMFALAAARAALQDQAFLQETYALNKAGKDYLRHSFTQMGLEFVPSFGNFILLKVGQKAAAINMALLKQGVIVRPVVGDELPEHLRISIGLKAENERFVKALQEALAQV